MNESIKLLSKASCLINVRLYNIGFSSRFSHVPENMDSSVITTLTKYLSDIEPIHNDDCNAENNICKIVMGTDKYLIVGIYGYLMDFIPDIEGKFNQFKDEAGRPSHGIVALVWEKKNSNLPDRFPTLDSFANVIRSEILTPLPEKMILNPPGTYLSDKQIEIIKTEWNNKTPEEQWRQLVPWFLQDGIDWSTALHDGTGHKVKYKFPVSLEGENPGKAFIGLLNCDRQDRVKVFNCKNESQLLNAAVYVAGSQKKYFSFRTHAEYLNRETTYYMNITCDNSGDFDEGFIEKNGYQNTKIDYQRDNCKNSAYFKDDGVNHENQNDETLDASNFEYDNGADSEGYKVRFPIYIKKRSEDIEIWHQLSNEMQYIFNLMYNSDDGLIELLPFNVDVSLSEKAKELCNNVVHHIFKNSHVNEEKIFAEIIIKKISNIDIKEFIQNYVSMCNDELTAKYGQYCSLSTDVGEIDFKPLKNKNLKIYKKTKEDDSLIKLSRQAVNSSNNLADLSSLVKKKSCMANNNESKIISKKKKRKNNIFD